MKFALAALMFGCHYCAMPSTNAILLMVIAAFLFAGLVGFAMWKDEQNKLEATARLEERLGKFHDYTDEVRETFRDARLRELGLQP